MDFKVTAINKIFEELRKAEKKFPGFPLDVIHGASILGEEAGSVLKAANNYYYGRSDTLEKLEKEIAQVGAMSFRFLFRLLDPKYYPEQKKE